MRRREYLQAAAVLLGATTVASGSAVGSHDDDRYDVALGTFDDVTSFRPPRSQDRDGRTYLRLYDASAETLVYATAVGGGTDVAMAVRDATEFDGSA
jgi:hypothetical protein